MIELYHGSDTAHQVASHRAASSTPAIASRAMPEVINKEVNVYASIKRYNITILKEAWNVNWRQQKEMLQNVTDSSPDGEERRRRDYCMRA